MKANIRGTKLFFDTAGTQFILTRKGYKENPVVFLLHGGPGGNHFNFKRDYLALADKVQLIFIDNRGSGFSSKSDANKCTMQNNIEDIEALRKYLGLKKICLLGVSYGGMVAQGYAIRYSKNLTKLILTATAPSFHFIKKAQQKLQTIGNEKQVKICEELLWQGKFKNYQDVARYFNIMDSLYSLKKNSKKTTISAKSAEKILDYKILNKGFSDFLHTFDFIPKLKKIKCPTLIVAGKQDWICDPQNAKIIAQNIPLSSLKIFANCGHAIAKDQNKKYIRLIKKFLTS